jgi:hypothetical protein
VDVAETGGLMLLRAGLITQEQLARANQARREQGGTLGCHLVALDLISEEQLADFFRHRLMVPRIGQDALTSIAKKVIAVVPPDMAAEFRVVPVSVDREGNLTLAMADPSDTHAVDEVGFFTGHFVMRAVTTESAIAWALDKYYSIPTAAIPKVSVAPPAPAPAPASIPPEVREGEVVLLTKPKTPTGQHPVVAPAEPVAATPEPIAAPPEPVAAPMPPATAGEVVVEPVTAADDTLQPVLLQRPAAAPEPAAPAVLAPVGEEGVTLVHVELSTSGRIAAVTTPDAPATSPASEALTQAIRALREVATPEAVGGALLGYFSSFCGRAAFFTVRKGRLKLGEARGPDVTAAAPDFDVNVDDPSAFREVIASRFPYRGPLGDSPPAAKLRECFLPPGTEDVVLVPVAVRHRVVSLAYGDRLTGEPSEAGMTRVALEAGSAYERLIASKKKG